MLESPLSDVVSLTSLRRQPSGGTKSPGFQLVLVLGRLAQRPDQGQLSLGPASAQGREWACDVLLVWLLHPPRVSLGVQTSLADFGVGRH